MISPFLKFSQFSCSVVSDSLRPQGPRGPARSEKEPKTPGGRDGKGGQAYTGLLPQTHILNNCVTG